MTTESTRRTFPEFSLSRLLKTVFEPKPGQRIGILIDLADPKQIAGFAFLKDTKTPEILVPEARMFRDDKVEVVIENYRPARYLEQALNT